MIGTPSFPHFGSTSPLRTEIALTSFVLNIRAKLVRRINKRQ